MSLSDRVVHTNISSVKGYVRKVNDHAYLWTLKDWEPEGPGIDVPPFIMSHGYTQTPREAFQQLYREIEYFTLGVIKEQEKGDE